MNTKLSNVKNFVQKNKTVIAASFGVVAGASITYYTTIQSRTLLELTAANVNHMRENGVALLYVTDFGDVMLTVPKHP